MDTLTHHGSWIICYFILLLLPIFITAPKNGWLPVKPVYRIGLGILFVAGLPIVAVREYHISADQFKNDIWYAIYAFFVIGPILTAILRSVIDRDYYMSVISSLVVVFVPAACAWYLKQDDKMNMAKLEITLNFQSLLVSCFNIIVMFIVTFWILVVHMVTGRPWNKSGWTYLYEFVLVCLAVAALFWAKGDYEHFVMPAHYEKPQTVISWVAPATVACPMNWFRIWMAVLMLPSLFVVPWNHRDHTPAVEKKVV